MRSPHYRCIRSLAAGSRYSPYWELPSLSTYPTAKEALDSTVGEMLRAPQLAAEWQGRGLARHLGARRVPNVHRLRALPDVAHAHLDLARARRALPRHLDHLHQSPPR